MTDVSLDQLRSRGAGTLVELLGIEFLSADGQRVSSRLTVRPALLAPNGYLHAATIIALADTSCGYGSMRTLPAGAQGFTTIELKTNFLGTVRTGGLACTAALLHGGRTTQVWDATVSDEATGKTIALFRCTQLLLYPHGG
ncbi:MAG TPA: PaaI family thioesterase [Chloroflexota bacterium]|nr:PaaI family thioesterase [Chloroflexota bacterium]